MKSNKTQKIFVISIIDKQLHLVQGGTHGCDFRQGCKKL